MSEAYIVDAVRTPIGRKKGSLATLHSADLGAHAIKALMQRTGLDPAAVDHRAFVAKHHANVRLPGNHSGARSDQLCASARFVDR